MRSSGQAMILPYISPGFSSRETRFPVVFPIFLPDGSVNSFKAKTNFSLFFILLKSVLPASMLNV